MKNLYFNSSIRVKRMGARDKTNNISHYLVLKTHWLENNMFDIVSHSPLICCFPAGFKVECFNFYWAQFEILEIKSFNNHEEILAEIYSIGK